MDVGGIDANAGRGERRRHGDTERRQAAVIGIGIGQLAFQRDARPESVGGVERNTPQLLVIGVDAGRRGTKDRRRALLVAAILTLETEGPGVDGVAGTTADHPAIVAG